MLQHDPSQTYINPNHPHPAEPPHEHVFAQHLAHPASQHPLRPAGIKVEGSLQQYARQCQAAVGMNQQVTFTRTVGFCRYFLVFGNEKMVVRTRRTCGGLEGGQQIGEHNAVGIVDRFVQFESSENIKILPATAR